jgi:hypothetical protein
MRTRACQTLVAAAWLVCAGVAHAQVARSQFNGTVTDSAGGVLVGATVVATNVETNVESKATTTDAGIYVLPYLANGVYKLRVTAAGFRPAEATQVTLRAAQTLTLDFKLDVDTISEVLTVSAPVIETSTAEIGHYVSSKEYQTWPIAVSDGQRQVQQFIFSSLPGSTGGTFEGAINGGRNYSHEILIEGIPLGRNLQGGSNNEMSPPTEMVGEFKLQTGTLGAEFGGGQTAVANFVVKSGTNDFHGSGAIYLQDSSMDARPFVAKATGQNVPVRELQNWAVAVGGPVMLPKYNGKNRSFFYATFEKTHAEEQTSTSFRNLPTREFQNGDFSRLFDPGYTGDARSGTVIGTDALGRPVRFGQIYDPRTTRNVGSAVVRDPFPNNQIPRAMWDAVARNTHDQGLWDAPALDKLLNNQPVLATCCPVFDQKTFATKYDQVLNDKHKLSFFVNREWRERNNSGPGRYGPPPGQPTNLYQLQSTPSWMIRASENWVISDRLLHRFAFGYNRFGNANRSVYFNAGWPSKIGLTNQPDTTFPRFAFAGTAILGGNLGNYGSLNRNETFEGSTIVQDDLTIVMGKHSIKTGFEGRFYYLESDSADGTATYNFNSAQTNLPGFDTQTGHAYGSFLLGAVQTSSRPVQIVNPWYYQNNYDLYVQDDYKVSPKLTLNLGVRWQILPGLNEKNGYMTNLDLTLPNTAAGNRPGALRFADREGEKTFIDTYYGQVQPRLGVAYAVSPEMAISGGFSSSNRPAIAYADGENFVTLNSAGYNGTISITRATRPTPNSQDPVMFLSEPYPNLTGTFPNYDPNQLNNQGVGTVLRGDEARRERYNNYNVTLRRQLPANFSTTIAYIGAYGTRLPFMPLDLDAGNEINRMPFDAMARYGDLLFSNLSAQPGLGIPLPYPGFTGTVQQALRPYPQFTNIRWQNSFNGKTRYDSFQATVERHFRNDFALLAAYTLSKTEDNYLKQDGSGDEWSYASGGRHYPHFLKLTWIYEVPVGPGKKIDVGGVLGQIVGGWTITGIHNYRSGGTLSVSDPRINGAGYPIRPDVVSGVEQVIFDGSHLDAINGTPYLNRAAFATQPLSPQGVPSQIGTAPPILDVRGPALYTEDLGFLKRFGVNDKTAEFRLDIINLFNRSGLGGPNTDLSSPNFGKITSVGQGARRLQVSLRATF